MKNISFNLIASSYVDRGQWQTASKNVSLFKYNFQNLQGFRKIQFRQSIIKLKQNSQEQMPLLFSQSPSQLISKAIKSVSDKIAQWFPPCIPAYEDMKEMIQNLMFKQTDILLGCFSLTILAGWRIHKNYRIGKVKKANEEKKAKHKQSEERVKELMKKRQQQKILIEGKSIFSTNVQLSQIIEEAQEDENEEKVFFEMFNAYHYSIGV